MCIMPRTATVDCFFPFQKRMTIFNQRYDPSLGYLILKKGHPLKKTKKTARHTAAVSFVFIFICFIRALLKEGLPKDVRSGLLREPVTHWNLILPQIICYIVVLKVLKLQIEWSLAYPFFNLALS